MLLGHRCEKAITPGPLVRIRPLAEPLVARRRPDGLGARFERENAFVGGGTTNASHNRHFREHQQGQ